MIYTFGDGFASGHIWSEWSKQYANIRDDEIQPMPIIHVKYVIEKLLPKININIDPKVRDSVYSLVENIKFVPFDADRNHTWEL